MWKRSEVISGYCLTDWPKASELVITSNDIIVLPELLFFGESGLNIDFFLHFPALLDIIIFFNPDGNIIDYITKSRFFT